MKLVELKIVAMAALGQGLSGGDRIFIELARRLAQTKIKVTVYVWEEGLAMCKRQHLTGVNYQLWPVGKVRRLGFGVTYIYRIGLAIWKAFGLKIESPVGVVVYSASEFWMDALPALILKWRYPQLKWVATWYQTAPNPLRGFNQGRYRFSALLYWLVQQPIKPLIRKWADLVLVNNQAELGQFPTLAKLDRVQVVLGAVDVEGINQWRQKMGTLTPKYAVIFQGRFHPQKGVVELIDIWSRVVESMPDAKLVMIGDGPLMPAVKQRIQELKLGPNVELAGYLFDGSAKYRLMAQSQLVVHPAFYDSGGMAAAEAMAFGLPGVCFDLESLKSYYPQGMIKVNLGDLDQFAKAIKDLLSNKDLYNQTRHQALELVNQQLSWDSRVVQIRQWIEKL